MRRNNQPSESNRYDGAPAPKREQPAPPSQSEIKRQHREHLASEGCHICGHDDPDELVEERPRTHDCPVHQSPHPEPRVVCESGHASKAARWWQDVQARATDRGMAVVVYACHITAVADQPDQNEVLTRHGYSQPRGRIPVECECGAAVETIVYPRGGDGDE